MKNKVSVELSKLDLIRMGLGSSVVYNDLFILESLKMALITPFSTDEEKLEHISNIVIVMDEVFKKKYKKHIERNYNDLYE